MWKQIISELSLIGMTQVQIAKHCGCGQASISDLVVGNVQHPRYPLAVALKDLHKKNSRKISAALAKQTETT